MNAITHTSSKTSEKLLLVKTCAVAENTPIAIAAASVPVRLPKPPTITTRNAYTM